MEDEEIAPANTRVQRLSAAAFKALKDKGVPERELQLLEKDLQGEQVDDKVKRQIRKDILATYEKFYNRQLSRADIYAATDAATAELRVIQSQPPVRKASPKTHKLVPVAFDIPYEGDADVSFQKYLAGCCHAYLDDKLNNKYTAPYVTITQSSGFGKSRIVKRLAEKDDPIEHSGTQFDVKVLYVCARTIERSSGYPCATPELRKWLLSQYNCSVDRIAISIEKAFTYSIENSDVREKWLKLFEVEENYTVDADMKRELDKVQLRPSTFIHPVKKRKKPTVIPVLVVAIDEARSLLEIKYNNGSNALQFLRRALIAVNRSSTLRRANGLVFGVLVDTNPQVHDFAAANMESPSSRIGDSPKTVLFPPFVLTETMDIMMKKLGDGQKTSKSRVLTTDENDVWTALVSLGRPLWRSMDDTKYHWSFRAAEMVRFAARKLLIGLPSYHPASYTDSTLHGVASLLCRLGLQPHSFSPMAPLLVANFMSVLHYVTYKNDAYISGYVSEPILTFGASHMWYQLEHPFNHTPIVLLSDILPQFQTMLLNGEIDTSNIGEPVSRIFLLLAMDAVAMGSSNKRKQDFIFSGEFCDVQKLVQKLVGGNPQIREGETEVIVEEEKVEAYRKWVESWNGWQVCFSHFVDLKTEPTKDVLWKLLDRRAAGVLPREQLGADLIIPIFHPKDSDVYPEGSVSFILVKVKSQEDADDEFPDSALRELAPSYVFEKTDGPNSLHTTSTNGMIRLYLSLLEVPNETTIPAQSIVTEKMTSHDKVAQEFDGALCVRGILAASSDGADDERWPFLSKGLAEKLREVANAAWWDGQAQVENDLKDRSEQDERNYLSSVLSKDAAKERASNTLHFA